MPCYGIAVAILRRKAQQQDNMAKKVIGMLQDEKISHIREGNKFQLDTKPPINLAIEKENVTIISVDGSFEDGKVSIEQLIEQLQELDDSLNLDGEIETHVHDGQGDAPQQAYAESSVGR